MIQFFKQAFFAYKRNFGKLFIPMLIMQLAILLPMLFFTMPGMSGAVRTLLVLLSTSGAAVASAGSVLPVFAYIVLMLLFFSPFIISNTVYVLEEDTKGNRVTVKQSLSFSAGNYLRMLSAYFAVVVMALPVLFYALLILSHFFKHQIPTHQMHAGHILLLVSILMAGLLYFMGTTFVSYVVVHEEKGGFPALFASFRYLFRGHFIKTMGRLASGGLVVVAIVGAINALAQLPFLELFDLYLVDKAAALQEPLMFFAMALAVLAIFLAALITPFWYSFSYHTYRDTKLQYELDYGDVDAE